MLSGVKASVFSGAIVSGNVVSGTVVVGTVSTVLSSPGPDDSNRAPAAKHGRAPHRRRAPGRRLLRVPEHHVLAERPALKYGVRSLLADNCVIRIV